LGRGRFPAASRFGVRHGAGNGPPRRGRGGGGVHATLGEGETRNENDGMLQ